ncbi:ATPase domain-containing protein [Ferruginivarius sediminum]|nr:ATPase domain-containing protein [Ferruginivarius sediminum]
MDATEASKEILMPDSSPRTADRLSSGIAGLDHILQGGFIPGKAYLVRGGPGAGKTTLGFHFLTASPGDKTLFISLGEAASQLKENAIKQNLAVDNVEFLDVSPDKEFFTDNESYDIFNPAEVERAPLVEEITAKVEECKPKRVVVDSITQLRYLSPDAFQFRKQVLGFVRYLDSQEATVLLTSESSPEAPDNDVRFLVDGILEIEHDESRRCVTVAKFRGSGFKKGRHDMELGPTGAVIYPRLMPGEYHCDFAGEPISSGIPDLDQMLHGGLERGTTTIVSGPSGVGKTTFGLQFMKEAAGRGERSVVFAFEEQRNILIERCRAINIPVDRMIEQGTLVIKEMEALTSTADQFAEEVRHEVERNGTRIVMLDSISGYQLTIRSDRLTQHMHALCRYLMNMGVTVILPNEIDTVASADLRVTNTGISYLADTIVLLRYFEIGGTMQKSVGILKKRTSNFEKSIRQFDITRYGLKVGPPLRGLQGILSGTPQISETAGEVEPPVQGNGATSAPNGGNGAHTPFA